MRIKPLIFFYFVLATFPKIVVGAEEKAFISESREVISQQEWNREIIGGKPIVCDIKNSSGSMDVLLIADRSYQAMLVGNRLGMHKEDLVYQNYSFSGESNMKIHINEFGSYWFIIKNDTLLSSTITLRCENT